MLPPEALVLVGVLPAPRDLEGREPNASVAQVLPTMEVMDKAEKMMQKAG